MGLEPVHISRLRLMAESAFHYAAGYGETETYAMERGTATHAMLFETQRILSWREGKKRQSKEYDAFAADNPDALILTFTEYKKVEAMVASVRRNREAMSVLDGTRETMREWAIAGRACAGTPDVVTDRFVTELKTCPTSNPRRFLPHGTKMGYHAQLAWYMDGVMQGGQLAPDEAHIVAVASSWPFVTTMFTLTALAVEKGRCLYRLWWEQLAVCEGSDEWPAYAQGAVPFDVPDMDQELDFGDVDAVAEAA